MESYIKYAGNFFEKSTAVDEIPKGIIVLTADVVGLYLSIPHDRNLEVIPDMEL